ncbi:MAG: TonB-dependent receptor [Bacteroidetes bacterium]|nr:TonB-dependent receptor [Bacteroidota bacterium]
MAKQYLFIILFFTTSLLFAQNGTVTGTITDKKTKETLIGATIVLNEKTGVTSDEKGNFSLFVKPGKHQLTIKLMGYAGETRNIEVVANEKITLNVELEDKTKVLDEVVVSAGRFEQKLSEVTVSMEIIKPSTIENNNTTRIDEAITKIPGVTIMDDQASIRGGSGYSYGAGSRVLLLVDDLPMLSGSAGDVKWDFAPVENIDQIEIIKGAASALYGSSALNGIINIRTYFPGNIPQTKVIFSSGIYMNPERKDIIWWGNTQPTFSCNQFSHSRKMGNFDLTVGGALLSNSGYRQNNDEQSYRGNFNTRYRSKKHKGLSYGINANFMNRKGGEFLLWQDGDSGVYKPASSFLQRFSNSRVNIDPYIVYFNEKGARHSLRTRYFNTTNKNDTGQDNKDDLYYGEYQFQKHYKNELTWTSGITGNYCISNSLLFGNRKHYSSSAGIYTQLDRKFGNLSVSIGGRWEGYKLDESNEEINNFSQTFTAITNTIGGFFKDSNSKPVFRTGLNYQLFEYTFLRTSFGQGFRYPTIAEKYTQSSVGSLNLFPNENLKPETGWSAELGFKQGFKISRWKGYIDVAGFWTQYHNMIEFTFGQHNPDSVVLTFFNFSQWTGFKAENISNAQINGIDISIMGQGKLFGLPATLVAGYTYTNPIDLDVNRDSLKTTDANILKYRFYHSAKIDLEVTYRKFTAGVSAEYNSNIINIDKAFEDPLFYADGVTPIIQNGDSVYIMPGLKDYRAKHNKGDIVLNVRLSYQILESSKLSIVIRNLLNREYMIRPGDVQAPRNIALQYSLKF